MYQNIFNRMIKKKSSFDLKIILLIIALVVAIIFLNNKYIGMQTASSCPTFPPKTGTGSGSGKTCDEAATNCWKAAQSDALSKITEKCPDDCDEEIWCRLPNFGACKKKWSLLTGTLFSKYNVECTITCYKKCVPIPPSPIDIPDATIAPVNPNSPFSAGQANIIY